MTVETKEKSRDRQAWMGLLARAEARDLARLWEGFGPLPAHEVLRAPEIGLELVAFPFRPEKLLHLWHTRLLGLLEVTSLRLERSEFPLDRRHNVLHSPG